MIAEIVIAGSSGGLIHGLLMVLLVGLCVAAIWWVGRWFIGKMALPPMAMTIWSALFLLVGLIVLINFVMGLGGHPLVSW